MKNGSFGVAVVLMIIVALPVAADHYPQTRFQLSDGGGDKHIPNVEWNWQDDEYLTIWHRTPDVGYRSIDVQRVDSDGSLVGPGFSIANGYADRAHPSLAYNGLNNQYLAVYMKDHNNDGEWQIWGRLLNEYGSGVADEFLIRDRPGLETWTPRVAWNSYRNEYGVTWWNYNPGTGAGHSIGFQRLAANGTQLGTYVTVAVTNDDRESDITYNVAQDEYMIVWTLYDGTSPNGGIRARRIGWDGVGQGDPTVVTQGSNESRYPSVSTNGQGFYVIAWEEYVISDWDIHAQFHASSDLATIGARVSVSSEWDIDEGRPRVDVNRVTGQALVVYKSHYESGGFIGGSIEAAVINRYQGVPELKFLASAVVFYWFGDPAIAWGNGDFISIYTSSFSGSTQEIAGCMLGLVHVDDFESGNTAIWSESAP